MNRLVSSTSRTFNGAMRYYSNLINLNESEWLEYRLSDNYDDDEFVSLAEVCPSRNYSIFTRYIV